ncbi:MAG TPA: hypothetical protein ENI91_08080 [Sphingomonadales bacterium]|nr:hypothetical protein [Sphingomonadales bacterium]
MSQIKFIKRSQRMGFSLEKIKELRLSGGSPKIKTGCPAPGWPKINRD